MWQYYTNRIALMQPSFSGLFVTCANLPQTTLPVVVTNPKSDTFTYFTYKYSFINDISIRAYYFSVASYSICIPR
jgi:hypothetical protein